MNLRRVKSTDKNEWARMRNSLWPGSLKEHFDEIGSFFSKGDVDLVEVFVLERNSGKLGGFIELNVRNYAEGSSLTKVPYVEGWYVDEDVRGGGYGKQLIEAAESWARDNEFDELASDAELENSASIAAHKALGFQEVERVVCFIKRLG
jgi:aminoglycoside 6'-N-acetyltransferase I